MRQFCTSGLLNAATQHIFKNNVGTLEVLLNNWEMYATSANLTPFESTLFKDFFTYLKAKLTRYSEAK